MNANYSQIDGRWTRRTALLSFALLLFLGAGRSDALVHAEHSLRYVGWFGWKPVTVEVTLRRRPGELYEYREWIAPRWWAAMLGDASATRTLMRISRGGFRLVAPRSPEGAEAPGGALAEDIADTLSVRLDARGDLAAANAGARYRVLQEDGTIETWQLDLTGTEAVETPDGTYQTLTFRLGNDKRWILGWSAPLLSFHFVRLEFWEDGDRAGVLELDAKELWD